MVRISKLVVVSACTAAATLGGLGVASAQPPSQIHAGAEAVASDTGPKCSHPCTPSPGDGWKYQDYFFFQSDCDNNGRHGESNGLWKQHQCLGGDTFTDYDLLVKP